MVWRGKRMEKWYNARHSTNNIALLYTQIHLNFDSMHWMELIVGISATAFENERAGMLGMPGMYIFW